jgi:hypothetical protein
MLSPAFVETIDYVARKLPGASDPNKSKSNRQADRAALTKAPRFGGE